jgi:hypothetical protein
MLDFDWRATSQMSQSVRHIPTCELWQERRPIKDQTLFRRFIQYLGHIALNDDVLKKSPLLVCVKKIRLHETVSSHLAVLDFLELLLLQLLLIAMGLSRGLYLCELLHLAQLLVEGVSHRLLSLTEARVEVRGSLVNQLMVLL